MELCYKIMDIFGYLDNEYFLRRYLKQYLHLENPSKLELKENVWNTNTPYTENA